MAAIVACLDGLKNVELDRHFDSFDGAINLLLDALVQNRRTKLTTMALATLGSPSRMKLVFSRFQDIKTLVPGTDGVLLFSADDAQVTVHLLTRATQLETLTISAGGYYGSPELSFLPSVVISALACHSL
jgi:hypothetical protein